MAFDSFSIRRTCDDSEVSLTDLNKLVCEHFGLVLDEIEYGEFRFEDNRGEFRQESISWAGLIHVIITYSSIEYGKRSRYDFIGALEYIRYRDEKGILPLYRQNLHLRLPKSSIRILAELLAFLEDNGYYVFVNYTEYFIQNGLFNKVNRLAKESFCEFVDRNGMLRLTHSTWSALIANGFPVIITDLSYKDKLIDTSELDTTPLAEKIALKLLSNDKGFDASKYELKNFAEEYMYKALEMTNTILRQQTKYDPIEDTRIYKSIEDALENDLDIQLWDSPRRGKLGFCHEYWKHKKLLLKEKYGIDWRSPAELNPDKIFD